MKYPPQLSVLLLLTGVPFGPLARSPRKISKNERTKKPTFLKIHVTYILAVCASGMSCQQQHVLVCMTYSHWWKRIVTLHFVGHAAKCGYSDFQYSSFWKSSKLHTRYHAVRSPTRGRGQDHVVPFIPRYIEFTLNGAYGCILVYEVLLYVEGRNSAEVCVGRFHSTLLLSH